LLRHFNYETHNILLVFYGLGNRGPCHVTSIIIKTLVTSLQSRKQLFLIFSDLGNNDLSYVTSTTKTSCFV